MNERMCPFNQRICSCDPDAANEKLRPCVRSKRAAKLVAMLGSSDHEQISALRRLEEFLKTEGVTFTDLAITIESKQFTIDEARHIFKEGEKKGRVEEARAQQAPPEFWDADGTPRWYEIAVFCQQNGSRLSDWEQNFLSDMPARMIKYGEPKGKQIQILLGIFVKLGGPYDPKTCHIHR